MGDQCLGEGSWGMNPQPSQCTMYSGDDQGTAIGMSFEDGIRRLNAKLDCIMLNIKLDNVKQAI